MFVIKAHHEVWLTMLVKTIGPQIDSRTNTTGEITSSPYSLPFGMNLKCLLNVCQVHLRTIERLMYFFQNIIL